MLNISLNNLANIAEIIGATSIVSGLIFGLFQLRYFRAQRRDTIATNLTQTFYNKDLAQALALLQTIPDNISLEDLHEKGNDYTEAAITVTTSFETMGLLVYKRIATLELVCDLAGGIIITMNKKLAQWQEDMREKHEQPSWGEWFDWLSDQVERKKTQSLPAHILHKDWRP